MNVVHERHTSMEKKTMRDGKSKVAKTQSAASNGLKKKKPEPKVPARGRLASKGGANKGEEARMQPDPQKYDKYVGMVKASNYNLDESVGNVNVIGIRGWMDGNVVENIKGQYNDTIICVYQSSDDKGNVMKYCAEFIASVDPGSFVPDYTNPNLAKRDNEKGIANLIGGQYTYQQGRHSGYMAYKSVDKSKVWRDKNNDGNQDKDDMSEDTGHFDIDIHAAGNYQRNVANWSKGCQVIASKDNSKGSGNTEFQRFREIINKHDQDKKFVYTLLEGKTAWDAYQQVTATANK